MIENSTSAVHYFEQIKKGDKSLREYEITPRVYKNFLSTFEDANPLHINRDYAMLKGFQGQVMHGAILNGFISHFIGMHFPGEKSLLQSMQIQYKFPAYLNDKILLESIVIQKIESVNVLVLEFVIKNLTQKKLAAKARVQVGIL